VCVSDEPVDEDDASDQSDSWKAEDPNGIDEEFP